MFGLLYGFEDMGQGVIDTSKWWPGAISAVGSHGLYSRRFNSWGGTLSTGLSFCICNCWASECKEKWGRGMSVSREPNFNWLQVCFVSSYLTELMVKCWHMIWESVFLFPSQPAHGLNCQWEPQSNHRCLNQHRPSKRYTIPLPTPQHPPSEHFPRPLPEGVLSCGQNCTPGLLVCWKALEK